jgi:hypothetical protein
MCGEYSFLAPCYGTHDLIHALLMHFLPEFLMQRMRSNGQASNSIFILQFFMLFMVKNHPGHSKYHDLKPRIPTIAHPAMRSRPPMGVMAPSQLILVRARA